RGTHGSRRTTDHVGSLRARTTAGRSLLGFSPSGGIPTREDDGQMPDRNNPPISALPEHKDDGLNVPPKQEGRRIRHHHQTQPYETKPCLSWKQPHPRKDRATLMQHIGDRIREYRMLHGLTQEDLAEKAGMHPNTIKKLEQGGTARMDTLHRIARALNTTTGSLI